MVALSACMTRIQGHHRDTCGCVTAEFPVVRHERAAPDAGGHAAGEPGQGTDTFRCNTAQQSARPGATVSVGREFVRDVRVCMRAVYANTSM